MKLYNEYKGRPINLFQDQLWEEAIIRDFETFRKSSIDDWRFAIVEKNINSPARSRGPDLISAKQEFEELFKRGSYEKAKEAATKYLALAKERLGENHVSFSVALVRLGRASEALGEYKSAESLFQRALSIRLNVLGDQHSDVAHAYNDLGLLCEEQGRFAEAALFFEHALRIWDKNKNSDSKNAARALKSLADVYSSEGHYNEALPLLERSLHLAENSWGLDHVEIAYQLNSLARPCTQFFLDTGLEQ
jgi:tetratricopeptide (TPR) repeat protein